MLRTRCISTRFHVATLSVETREEERGDIRGTIVISQFRPLSLSLFLPLPPRLTFSRLTRLEHGFNCVPWLPGERRITDPRPLTLGRIPEYGALQKNREEGEGRNARVQKKIRASEVRIRCVVTTLPRRRRERGERAAKKHGDLLVNEDRGKPFQPL